MISRNQIKYLNSLRVNKYRNIHRQFIAEGNKIILELLSSKQDIVALYATKEWLEINKKVLKGINDITEVTSVDLGKISGLTTASEVFAVLRIPGKSIDSKIFGTEMVLMLDSIRDPGNLGTIIRTADWFGIKNIICSDDSVDVYNPKVVQSSMGSIARVNVHYGDLKEILNDLKSQVKVYGTFADGRSMVEMKLYHEGIIIIGSEARGISEELSPFITERISISPYNPGKVESLNAAIACGIVLYEFRRSHNDM